MPPLCFCYKIEPCSLIGDKWYIFESIPEYDPHEQRNSRSGYRVMAKTGTLT